MHHLNCNFQRTTVFTDMDGTLLGHHDYGYAPVLPVLQQLKQKNIPVVVNSSKTFAEIVDWLAKLDLTPPFIAENGGVIYLPAGKKQILGTPYGDIRSLLQTLRAEHGWQFEGFGDMSVQRIAEVTGLNLSEAQKAGQREVTEPLLWQDSEAAREEFENALRAEDLQLVRGGRFYHVMGKHDKASAMLDLLKLEHPFHSPDKPWHRQQAFIVALGDGNNDKSMLQAADLAVVLPAANFASLQIATDTEQTPKKVIYAAKPAPEGWADSMQEWLHACE